MLEIGGCLLPWLSCDSITGSAGLLLFQDLFKKCAISQCRHGHRVSVSMSQVWQGRCVPGIPCWDSRRGHIPWRAASLVLSIAGDCWLQQTACAGYVKHLESPSLFSYKRGFFEDLVALLLIKRSLSLCNHCATQAFVKGFCLLSGRRQMFFVRTLFFPPVLYNIKPQSL